MDVTVTAWVAESRQQNESDWQDIDKTCCMAYHIMNFLVVVIVLLGLAGNAAVLWLLGFRMQRNVFSVYILNLAGADFLYLFFFMLHIINVYLHYFNLDFIYIPQVLINMYVAPYVASLSILTTISTERCMSVLQPIWYRCRRPKHTSSVICVMIWTLSLLLNVLRLESNDFQSEEFSKYSRKSIDFSIATLLIFCSVLMFGSNVVLLTRLLCGSQKRKLTRSYVIIGLTVLVFLLCGLPSGIIWFLLLWMPIKYREHTHIIFLVLALLSCVNSCANPIIYFFVGLYKRQRTQYRRSLKVILQRALQEVLEEVGSQGSPPQETLEMSGYSHGS